MRSMLLVVFLCAARHAVGGCLTPPPAIIAIPGVAYYTDAAHSVRDPVLFPRNRDALKPLDQYLIAIAHTSDAYLTSDRDAGRCTLLWLTAWAKEGALLGEAAGGAQARSQRRWSAAAMALAALKVWDAAAEDDRAVIRSYILRLAQAVRRDVAFDKPRNTLLYWAGLGDMASAWLTNDTSLSERAVAVCRDAIASLTSQGSLPLEDLRGARAIDYNGFALFPLSVIATLNGTHRPGCSVDDLQPLAQYILDHRDRTSDPFLRWAPFMRTNVTLDPAALFYIYGGGSLPLVAQKLATLARERAS